MVHSGYDTRFDVRIFWQPETWRCWFVVQQLNKPEQCSLVPKLAQLSVTSSMIKWGEPGIFAHVSMM